MRVTHIITRLIVGGAQENTVTSVLGLHRKPGARIRLISGPTTGPEGSLEPLFDSTPGLLTIAPDLIRPVRPWRDWQALKELSRILAIERPDIVHTHSGKAGILGRLAAARAGVPIIVHTIHGPSFGRFQSPAANILFSTAERYAARVTTHFVVVADAMRDQYLAAGIGRPEMYTRVLSGFDLAPFLAARNDLDLRHQLGLDPSDIVIGKIARLTELKGHDDLFAIAPDLVKSNSRIRFLLVGDGPWGAKFKALALRMGLQNHFVFTGLVPPAQVPCYVGIMDILVHLSVREGLPRALPQALAAGRPIVAYNCDGANEVCFPNQTGFLIERNDHSSLKARLLQLAADPSLCEQFGAQGRELVRNRFSSQTMVDELHALYLRLANRASSVQPCLG